MSEEFFSGFQHLIRRVAAASVVALATALAKEAASPVAHADLQGAFRIVRIAILETSQLKKGSESYWLGASPDSQQGQGDRNCFNSSAGQILLTFGQSPLVCVGPALRAKRLGHQVRGGEVRSAWACSSGSGWREADRAACWTCSAG